MTLRVPVLFTTACAIAGVSGLSGSLILGPTLAVAVAAGGGLWLKTGAQRNANLYANVGAIIVPFVLEWTRALPRMYDFHDGVITVQPFAVALPEIPVRMR